MASSAPGTWGRQGGRRAHRRALRGPGHARRLIESGADISAQKDELADVDSDLDSDRLKTRSGPAVSSNCVPTCPEDGRHGTQSACEHGPAAELGFEPRLSSSRARRAAITPFRSAFDTLACALASGALAYNVPVARLDLAPMGRCAYLPLAGVFIVAALGGLPAAAGATRRRSSPCRARAAQAAPGAPRRSPRPSSSIRRIRSAPRQYAISSLQSGAVNNSAKVQATQELQITQSELNSLESLNPPNQNGSALKNYLSALRDEVTRPDEQARRRRAGRRHLRRRGGGVERPLQRAGRRRRATASRPARRAARSSAAGGTGTSTTPTTTVPTPTNAHHNRARDDQPRATRTGGAPIRRDRRVGQRRDERRRDERRRDRRDGRLRRPLALALSSQPPRGYAACSAQAPYSCEYGPPGLDQFFVCA